MILNLEKITVDGCSIAKAYRPSFIDDAMPKVTTKEKKLPACGACGCKAADRVSNGGGHKHLCGYCRPKYPRCRVI